MPESQAERRSEQASDNGAPDPVQEDGERVEEAERDIAEAEAEQRGEPK